jgi:hypothetical protein
VQRASSQHAEFLSVPALPAAMVARARAASRLRRLADQLPADAQPATARRCPAAAVTEAEATLAEGVPTIDLAEVVRAGKGYGGFGMWGKFGDGLPAVEQIRRACSTWGFFQVVNHGVSAEMMADLALAVKVIKCPYH